MAVTAPEDLRRQNTASVLRALRRDRPATRAELAQRTGLAKATVGTIVADLTGRGVVAEGDLTSPARGRPGRAVALDGAGVVGVGHEVNVDYVATVAVDLSGRVLRESTTAVADADPFDVLCDVAASTRDALHGDGRRVVGTTVALPALVDRAAGVVATAPNLGWTDRPLAAEVAAVVGGPVAVENDASSAALAEAVHGAAAGTRHSVYVTGTVGVGAGIVHDGAIVRGASGFAGEIGHIPLGDPGALCGCGRRGCWEASVGLRAMLDLVEMPEHGTPLESARAVADRAAAEPWIRDALGDLGTTLGQGLATLAGLLDPDVIVLGGYFVPLADVLMPGVTRALDSLVAHPFHAVGVRPSTLGLTAAATGAVEESLSAVLTGATPV